MLSPAAIELLQSTSPLSLRPCHIFLDRFANESDNIALLLENCKNQYTLLLNALHERIRQIRFAGKVFLMGNIFNSERIPQFVDSKGMPRTRNPSHNRGSKFAIPL